jgi:hypothetical protein
MTKNISLDRVPQAVIGGDRIIKSRLYDLAKSIDAVDLDHARRRRAAKERREVREAEKFFERMGWR